LAGAFVAGVVLSTLAVPIVRETPIFQRLTEMNVMVARFDQILEFGLGESFHARYTSARFGIEAFLNAPVLGWGPENFAVAFDRFVDGRVLTSSQALADQAHNKFIGELTTKGLVGFAAYFMLIGSLFWTVVRAIRAERMERLFVLLVGAAFIGYVLQNLMLFDTPGTFLLFILLVGWLTTRGTQLQATGTPLMGGRGDPGASNRASGNDKQNKERGSGLRRWLEAHNVRPELLANISAVLVVLAVMVSIYFNVYRPYRAAQIFPLRGTSIETFFAQAQDSFAAFPPLATLGRHVAFDTLSTNWEKVNPELEAALLNQVQFEGEVAIRSEPQNARLHISLARIFQAAGKNNSEYLALARPHVEAALQLGPQLVPTLFVAIRQEIDEENYSEALILINSYDGLDPNARYRAKSLADEVRHTIILQIGQGEYDCRWANRPPELTAEERAEILCN
jgi:hypothetical protein